MNCSAEWLRCFFVKGEKQGVVEKKSMRISRATERLASTFTFRTRAHAHKKSERTSRHFPKRQNGPDTAPKRRKMDRGRWHTNTHTCSRWKQYPKKASQFDEVDDEKKKNSKREETVFQHACMGKYCSGTWKYRLIQACDAFFFPSKDVPMLSKMWRKQCLRTTTQSSSRQIFIPWKSWVIATEGAAR